ncbi:hypothetical protein Tsp_15272, partial [Trichinella spiralis]|uniref:hypothetical protein n=1 Tax=Trichinella spiralis TaxID=6334 RepID=UPI0001EFE489
MAVKKAVEPSFMHKRCDNDSGFQSMVCDGWWRCVENHQVKKGVCQSLFADGVEFHYKQNKLNITLSVFYRLIQRNAAFHTEINLIITYYFLIRHHQRYSLNYAFRLANIVFQRAHL